MSRSYYSLSSYNSKKREWQDETTATTITAAKKRAKEESKTTKRRWRIVKETIIGVYFEGKDINKQ